MSKTNELPSLELSLTEIADLIKKMEKNELTLEQCLTHFERGISLVKHCQKILGEAEQKVQLLMQNNQEENLVAFDALKDKGMTVDENCNE